ncbi:hypothetical protein [Halococcus salsus]|nr:hypothetical protein [Halococcus salsus]
MIPVLGVVVAAPVGFYATLVTAHLYASGFDAPTPAVENGTEPDAHAVA